MCPQDEDVARQLVELGYHTVGETLKREEFEARKKAEREKHLHKDNVAKPLASVGKDLSEFPFLQCLASREELVRNGKLTVCGDPPSPHARSLLFVVVLSLELCEHSSLSPPSVCCCIPFLSVKLLTLNTSCVPCFHA